MQPWRQLLALALLCLPTTALPPPLHARRAALCLRGGQDVAKAAASSAPGLEATRPMRSSADILAEIIAGKVRETRNLIASAVGLVLLFLVLLRLLGKFALTASVPVLQAIMQHEIMVAASKETPRLLQPLLERQHWLSFAPAVIWCNSRALYAGTGVRVPLTYDATVVCMLGMGIVGCLHQWQRSRALAYHVGRFILSIALQLLVTMPASAAIACSRFGLFWVAMPALTVAVHEAGQKLGDNFIGATPLSRLRPSQSREGYILAFFATLLASYPLAKTLASLQWISSTNAMAFPISREPQRRLFGLPFASRFGMRVAVNPLGLHAISIAIMVNAAVPICTTLVAAGRRSVGERDFSSPYLVRIPAHGGFLDRFASQVATALSVLVYLKCFLPSLLTWIFEDTIATAA